jgi:hypothetical protein
MLTRFTPPHGHSGYVTLSVLGIGRTFLSSCNNERARIQKGPSQQYKTRFRVFWLFTLAEDQKPRPHAFDRSVEQVKALDERLPASDTTMHVDGVAHRWPVTGDVYIRHRCVHGYLRMFQPARLKQ